MTIEHDDNSTVRAVDSHAHVFRKGLPLVEDRRYAPAYDAEPTDFIRLLDAHGLSHAVLVQPSFLGTDNRFLLEALRAHPTRLRGVAVLDPDATDGVLADLASGGVVGVRLNLIGAPLPTLRNDPWKRFLNRLGTAGMHVELHCRATELPTLAPPLLDAGVDIVVDHFGRPDAATGVDDPGFRTLLDLATTGKVWVKLSASYRLQREAGKDIALQAAASLLDAFGARRLLWGSDWPHTQHESIVSYADVIQLLAHWVPDAGARETILAHTPAQLFGLAMPVEMS